ncbi:hypothetical protein [Microbulbifer sp. HZ11]|uniref:hypothetical protein n=1 Tax=Microbulbifer sp. HZ11 TaxID=1453501 RepID=UPI00068F465E|nr:hypothetical protein [Microbulbifer sp. HZ11]
MNTFNKLLCTFTLVAASTAQAHDPSMHKENTEKANCAAMKEMDHSTMDADDPVMQAMMKKCAEQMQHAERDTHSEHAHHGEGHHHEDPPKPQKLEEK